LHADRGCARYDAPIADQLEGRPPERHRVDAMMLQKTPVFVSQQIAKQSRIDALARCWKSPSTFGRDVGPKQAPIAVDNEVRVLDSATKRHRPQRYDPPGRKDPRYGNRDYRHDQDQSHV